MSIDGPRARPADDESPVRVGTPEATCEKCGKTFPRLDEVRCGSCGTPRRLRLEFHDPQHYLRAVPVLRDASLLRRRQDFGGGLGGLGRTYYGLQTPGCIWIDAIDSEAAAAALAARDLPLPLPPMPLVDRVQPWCPFCHAGLPGDGPACCQHCGGAFCWSDEVDDGDDRTVLYQTTCHACGYDLTGLDAAQPRCPECGELAQEDLDALHDRALADHPPTIPGRTRARHNPAYIAAVAASAVVLGAAVAVIETSPIGQWLLGGAAAVAAVVYLVLIRRGGGR